MADRFSIGRVFTPLPWAAWLIEVTGAFQAWREGASVLDPTCGDGAFLEAFVALARREGINVSRDAIARLHGVEIVAGDKRRLLERLAARFGAELPDANIITADFITVDVPGCYDVIVGNPPWINFAALPDDLKAAWGPAYIRHGLVTDKRDVLLGGSRADVAALVLKKALDGLLADRGQAAFFIPLSLFFNSGANDRFRPFPGSAHGYRVARMWDFGDEDAFAGIATRYGAALFDRRGAQTWPVETDVRHDGAWSRSFSVAGDRRSGAWRRGSWHQLQAPGAGGLEPPAIGIQASQKPRQGINTCGANDIFLFVRSGEKLRNGLGEEWELEDELLFPLMNAGNFGRPLATAQRFILVPHDVRTGRPMTWDAIVGHRRAAGYLSRHREALARRRGTLINAHIRRGFWWSLLGVGPYAFAPWKVAWEALGKRSFTPTVLAGRWQGNQALHAFCPCATRQEADVLAAELGRAQVETWLKSSAMEGTCNWAQPGRIAQMLTIDGRPPALAGRIGEA
jgi:hypothetical protein